MKKSSVLVSALFVVSAQIAQAEITASSEEQVVKVAISKAYIPQGFDNNDITKVVVEGFFPNTCYKLKKQDAGDVIVNKDTQTIEVTQRAYVYQGMCLMMLVPFSETVEVGQLAEAGDYKVTDSLSTRELGRMNVAASRTVGPDDYNYAIVADAYLDVDPSGANAVAIHGELPGSCWALTEVKVFVDGKDVVTVLPIMEMTSEQNCDAERIPFASSVALPDLQAGRYLLNVRSLNGQAVNKLFDIK